MELSNVFFASDREEPTYEGGSLPQHIAMLYKAGLLRRDPKSASNIIRTPLGCKVWNKVRHLVREHMGNNEIETDEMIIYKNGDASSKKNMKNKAEEKKETERREREERKFQWCPSLAEHFAKLAGMNGNSYKTLPLTIYQLQKKHKEEDKPKYGLVGAKEFETCDAFSFDVDQAGLDISYNKIRESFKNIFDKLKVQYAIVKSDSGIMNVPYSEQFLAFSKEVGDETFVTCDKCDFSSNINVATCVPNNVKDESEMLPIEEKETPHMGTIEDVSKFLGLPAEKFVKTLICKAGKDVIVLCVRGDREVNNVKVKNLLKLNDDIELADEETVINTTHAKIGFAGPVGIQDNVKIVIDDEVSLMRNYIVGANKTDYHLINVNLERDYKADIIGDIKTITENDKCPCCGGKLIFNSGIEIAHIFKLGTKYSNNSTFLSKENKSKPYEMGCYELSIERSLAALIEQNYDANGIIWKSEDISPFKAVVIPISLRDKNQVASATEIYEELKKKDINVLLDNRDERAGVKFKDADLLGIPHRIVIGKAITQGIVEYKARTEKEPTNIPKEEILNKLI